MRMQEHRSTLARSPVAVNGFMLTAFTLLEYYILLIKAAHCYGQPQATLLPTVVSPAVSVPPRNPSYHDRSKRAPRKRFALIRLPSQIDVADSVPKRGYVSISGVYFKAPFRLREPQTLPGCEHGIITQQSVLRAVDP